MAKSNASQPRNTGSQLTMTNCGCDSHNFVLRNRLDPNRTAQDIQDDVDYWCDALSERNHKFLHNVGLGLSVKNLLEHWFHPGSYRDTFEVEEGQVHKLAHLYLRQGKLDLAKRFLLNVAFLRQIDSRPENIMPLFENKDNITDEMIKAEMPLYHAAILASATPESMKTYLDAAKPPRKQLMTADRVMSIVNSYWPADRKNKSDDANADVDTASIEIIFKDPDNNNEEVRMAIGLSASLKTLFNNYSEERGLSLRSLRFSYDGKTLFLSSAGNKTPSQLGMNNLDSITVSTVGERPQNQEDVQKAKSSPNSSFRGKKKKKCNTKGKTKKPRNNSPSFVVDDSAKFKINHSEALTKLFEEAEPKFKEIRQQINALNIKHTERKVKTGRKKSSIIVQRPIDNPFMEGIGGKAGKTSFVVQVGEVDNLYKTSKPSVRRNHALSASHSIVLDLHGFTKDQALAKLDDCLPEWTDIAMQGCYPFVQPVVIVCGGGNQVLSESVEHWIRQNDRVSNAPKNLLVVRS